MLSPTQKALIYANLPSVLDDITVTKYLRDRFLGPTDYPSMAISFLTEGIRRGFGTWAPINTYKNPDTQDWDSTFGEQSECNLSVTLWSENEDQLRELAYALETLIKIDRLGLDWATHHIKFTRFKNVTLLPPYPDEFNRVHSWRAVLDFALEYEFAELELADAIKAFTYLFEEGPITDLKLSPVLTSYMPGSFGMDICIRGSGVTYEALFACCVRDHEETFGLAVEFIT
jgi:hypothetical protein